MQNHVRGKSITIYLHRGEKDGVKHIEIPNWSGQALLCPRKLVSKLSDEDIIKRPVVYFLFGEEEGKETVYIGEAEDGFTRIKQHLSDESKEFFNELIIFSNKDSNLTKAHIKYLESRLIQMSKDSRRFEVKNGNVPVPSSLPIAAIDSMEEFIDNIKIIFDALRYKILVPLVEIVKPETSTIKEINSNLNVFLYGKKGVLMASGIYTNDGIIVFKDSLVRKDEVKSLFQDKYYFKLRQKLLADGNLIDNGEYYKFKDDYLFKSVSAAATVILATPSNGRSNWRDSTGNTINDLEKE